MSNQKVVALEKELSKAIQQAEEKEPKLGTYIWVPCSGNASIGNRIGHTGQIKVAEEMGNGHTRWMGTNEWVTKGEALAKTPGIIIGTSSPTLCEPCAIAGRS